MDAQVISVHAWQRSFPWRAVPVHQPEFMVRKHCNDSDSYLERSKLMLSTQARALVANVSSYLETYYLCVSTGKSPKQQLE